ncbi:MAG: Calx-beta domain-containing protein [Chthoniobacteraceae bacterium]
MVVPATVSIPAGHTKARFNITMVDNSVLDGTRDVTIEADTGDYVTQTADISVIDDETATLSVSLPSSVTEGASAGTGTVTVSSPVAADIEVNLTCSDPARGSVPTTVTIPAGSTSVDFPVQAVDDDIINGTENVTVTAHVANWTDGSASMDVLDNETTNLTVTLPTSISEGAGTVSGGAVSISGTLSTDLVVSLSSSDTSSLTVPTSVTIPAGKTFASFQVTAIDNSVVDGTRQVTVTGTASSFTQGQAAISVLDNEVDHFSISTIGSPQAINSSFPVTITALDANGNTVAGFTDNLALTASGGVTMTPATTGNFVGGVWNGRVTISTQATGITLTATGAGTSVQSNAFDVIGHDYNYPENWPAFGNGPAHTGYQPVTLGSAAFIAGWSKTYSQVAYNGLNQAAISSGLVAVTPTYNYGGTFVSVLDAATGNELWQHAFSDQMYMNAPTMEAGALYLNSEQNSYSSSGTASTLRLHALSGGVEWKSPFVGYYSSIGPVVDGSGVWFQSSGNLLGLNTLDGSSRFSSSLSTYYSLTPASSNGVVYTWNGGTLEAFDAISGSLLWQFLASYYNYPDGLTSPSIADGKAFVTSEYGLYAIDLSTHALVWSASGDYLDTPCVANGVVYARNYSGVVAFDENTGTQLGVYSTTSNSYSNTQPIVTDDSVIFSGYSSTYIFDLASYTLRQTINATGSLSFANGVLYITNTSGGTISTYYQSSATSITVTVPTSVVEGASSASGTITVSSAVAADTTIKLRATDPNQLTVPATVTIPAGQTSADFTFSVPDDTVLNGDRWDVISATADGYLRGGSAAVEIQDNETATLKVSAPVTVGEGSGSFQGTVSVYPVPSSDIIVPLSSSDPTALQVPSTVIISAGQSVATFTAKVIDDHKINGLHSATITAHVDNWTDGSATVNIADNENRYLSTWFSYSVVEGGTISATVYISGTLPSDLVISLTSSDPSRLSVPATVTIPAGSTGVNYTATATDNSLTDGMEVVSVTATASGFISSLASTTIYDDDVHHFDFSTISTQQIRGVPFSVTITAKSIDGYTIGGYSGTPALSATGSAGAVSITPTTLSSFNYGSWSGMVTVNDFVSNVVLTATDGSITSNSNLFSTGVGAFDHFAWGAVASSQQAGTPFSITLTAEDAGNNTVTGYSGSVALSTLGAPHTTGTGTIQSYDIFPYYEYSARVQSLYLPAEIGHAGQIYLSGVEPLRNFFLFFRHLSAMDDSDETDQSHQLFHLRLGFIRLDHRLSVESNHQFEFRLGHHQSHDSVYLRWNQQLDGGL